jgi:hypothetical protein
MLNGPRGKELGGLRGVREFAELAVVACSRAVRRGGRRACAPLWEATRRYHTALREDSSRSTADPNSQTPRSTSWTPITGANTKRSGGVIATVGRYTIDDRIEAPEEPLGLNDQLRQRLRVGMGGHRYFEPTALPDLEGAEGG